MKIAFLFIAEAYQVYHAYPAALALARMPGNEITIFYNDPDTPRHLNRIARAYGQPPPEARLMRRGVAGAAIQSVKILGLAKRQVMDANRADLMRYDAVVASEKNAAYLAQKRTHKRPVMVYIPHGSGDRAVAVEPRIAAFDLVLPTGPKTAQRFLELGLVRPGGYSETGYIKLAASARLGADADTGLPPGLPVALYNPHKARGLSSWRACITPMLSQFAGADDHALIVAPHIKMFRRRSQRVRDAWNARSGGNILIDTDSDRLLDNSYTSLADVYVGDVSSQVYEFLVRPRPCVFLNPRRLNWHGNPDFLFWELGEVVEHPGEILAAVRRAPERHAEFADKQRRMVRETLGGDAIAGDPEDNAARAIMEFLHTGKVAPILSPSDREQKGSVRLE